MPKRRRLRRMAAYARNDSEHIADKTGAYGAKRT